MSRSRALVFGGTGTVGAEVLRGFAEAGVPAVFTWHEAEAKARALSKEYGHQPLQADLREAGCARRVARESEADIFVHCAATNPARALAAVSDEDWRVVQAVNCHSAFVACQELMPVMKQREGGHIVFVGALDRTQTLPLPVPFAASQGMLSAMTMALAREVGAQGILVNMVALGILKGGLSSGLEPEVISDYKAMSALRRLGGAEEAAHTVLWLALENTYMSGKVLSVNGGI
jgi:NAD(P)-dependent dehydrogenase (short-subunit alcohol dehydrogenase family)